MHRNDENGLSGATVFALHIRRWKRAILNAYFPKVSFTYLPLYISEKTFRKKWDDKILASTNPTFLVWGPNAPPAVLTFAKEHGIPVYYLEDGFIRSLVPNASQSAPFSLTLDSRTPYFDSRNASDLEEILNLHDFATDMELIKRAREAIRLLLQSRLSKYNNISAGQLTKSSANGGRRRILVIGQVEDDASIKLGCDRPITNNDVVRIAATENPDCEILYRPHPDVLNGVRKRLSNPAEVVNLATIITDPLPLPDLLDTVDHVYTITSLGGFEALLRKIKVTVMGCPFYAGWGLTDDRQPNPRRRRKLTIEDVFAGAYILYPRYFNPLDGTEISFEECLELAAQWKKSGMPANRIIPVPIPEKPAFALFGPYGLLGWRHLMTAPIARVIEMVDTKANADDFRRNPILFFRELSSSSLRRLGKVLYPFD